MSLAAERLEEAVELPAASAGDVGKFVESECHHKAEDDHDVELHVDRCSDKIDDEPGEDHKDVEEDHAEGRAKMRESQADEHMVEVVLVGAERRPAVSDTYAHHSESVEDRYGKYREGERHKSETVADAYRTQ